MTGSSPDVLDVRLVHRVHAGLTIDAALRLGGEVGVVFGPSGAGKTTLLRLIAGLAQPASGWIKLGEETLFDATRRVDRRLRDRRIGMIFQDDRLFPHLSVAGNIRFGLKGWRRAEADARLMAHAVFGLLNSTPHSLKPADGKAVRAGRSRAVMRAMTVAALTVGTARR